MTMQIRALFVAWKPPLLLVDDRATVGPIADGKIRLEAASRKGAFAVELSREEAERDDDRWRVVELSDGSCVQCIYDGSSWNNLLDVEHDLITRRGGRALARAIAEAGRPPVRRKGGPPEKSPR
jgi:hypothetical protein